MERLARQAIAQPRRLRPSIPGQRQTRHPSRQHGSEMGVRGMADKQNRCRHGGTFLASDSVGAASTKILHLHCSNKNCEK
jgi:hypothetical protein